MSMYWKFGAIHPSVIRAFSDLNKIKWTVYQHPPHLRSEQGKTSGDWITFRMNNPAYIRKIRIVNGYSDRGIRCIALFVGSYKLNSKWIKLCKNITNIKRG
eukprot:908548_1